MSLEKVTSVLAIANLFYCIHEMVSMAVGPRNALASLQLHFFQVMGLLSLSQNDASFGRLLPHKTPELRDCLLLFIFHFFSNFRAQSLFAIFVTDPTFSGMLFVVLEIVV